MQKTAVTSRRRIVQGIAWATPAVLASAAIPAYAASPSQELCDTVQFSQPMTSFDSPEYEKVTWTNPSSLGIKIGFTVVGGAGGALRDAAYYGGAGAKLSGNLTIPPQATVEFYIGNGGIRAEAGSVKPNYGGQGYGDGGDSYVYDDEAREILEREYSGSAKSLGAASGSGGGASAIVINGEPAVIAGGGGGAGGAYWLSEDESLRYSFVACYGGDASLPGKESTPGRNISQYIDALKSSQNNRLPVLSGANGQDGRGGRGGEDRGVQNSGYPVIYGERGGDGFKSDGGHGVGAWYVNRLRNRYGNRRCGAVLRYLWWRRWRRKLPEPQIC